MNLKNPVPEEMYVMLRNITKRGIPYFELFYTCTKRSVTVLDFLEALRDLKVCSSYFIKNFFEDFPKRDEIFFDDSVIAEIRKIECYSEEDADKCFTYMIATFLSSNYNTEKYDFFSEVVKMVNFYGCGGARSVYEMTSDEPIFYTSYGDVNSIPAFVRNYTLTVESADEEETLFSKVEGVGLSQMKQTEILDILSSLSALSDNEMEDSLITRLKESLGL